MVEDQPEHPLVIELVEQGEGFVGRRIAVNPHQVRAELVSIAPGGAGEIIRRGDQACLPRALAEAAEAIREVGELFGF